MNAVEHIVRLLMNTFIDIVLKVINPNYNSIGSKEEKELINDINGVFFE